MTQTLRGTSTGFRSVGEQTPAAVAADFVTAVLERPSSTSDGRLEAALKLCSPELRREIAREWLSNAGNLLAVAVNGFDATLEALVELRARSDAQGEFVDDVGALLRARWGALESGWEAGHGDTEAPAVVDFTSHAGSPVIARICLEKQRSQWLVVGFNGGHAMGAPEALAYGPVGTTEKKAS